MCFPSVRSIDSLFDEAADYDLVVTPSAPLMLALNNRVDTPRLGRWAVTPKVHARGSNPDLEDRRALFQTIVQETELPWKHVHHLLVNALDCWEQTGDLDSFTSYTGFDGPAAEQVVDVLSSTPSAWRRMATGEARIYPGRVGDVAVLDAEQMTALDQTVLPRDESAVDEIPIRTQGTFDLPPFHVFPSKNDIVNALDRYITAERAGDVAVVLDDDSTYAHLVESLLESRNIPYQWEEALSTQTGVEAFLELTRLGLIHRRARVREVRPLLTRLGRPVSPRHNDKLVARVEDEALQDLGDYWDGLASASFGDAVDAFSDLVGADIGELTDLLDELDVDTEPLTRERLNDVAYYLDTFDRTVDRSRRGVLLASAATGGWVDRPLVFYLGMDVSWTRSIQLRPWRDPTEDARRHVAEFARLLQNGRRQVYLVEDTSMGEPVTPCYYLHEFLDRLFDRFTDLPHIQHGHQRLADGDGFQHRSRDASRGERTRWSASSLTTFVRCPRDYYFDQVVSEPARDYFERGGLFHDFAELYANRPDAVDEDVLDEFVELAADEMRPFVDELSHPGLRMRIRIAFETARAFLDQAPPARENLPGYSSEPLHEDRADHENVFADHLGIEIDSEITEQSFRNDDLAAHGVVDLIHQPYHLVDWKSGSNAPSTGMVLRRADIDNIDDNPDFQPVHYLAHHRTTLSDVPIDFSLVYLLGNVKDAVQGHLDVHEATVTVRYWPWRFTEFIPTESCFDMLSEEAKYVDKLLGELGYPAYRSFFEAAELPDPVSKDVWHGSALADEFAEHVAREVKDTKGRRKDARKIVKKLAGARGDYLFKEDLDRYGPFLRDQLDRLRNYRAQRFPVDDAALEEVNHRDLILRRL